MNVEDDGNNLTDEDDPVVEEIPIYLSKRLEQQLYVFQYPLKPGDDETKLDVRKAFIRPNNKEVQLEMGLNINSSNFDMAKAEHIARDVDGNRYSRKKDYKPYFENEIVDKIMYKSTKAIPDSDVDKYAVGVFNGKEYHITPLAGILQLRPSLEYLDRSNRGKKDAQNTANEDESDPDEPGPSTAQAVTVKFARNESQRTNTSYTKLKERSDSERWIECEWQGKQTTSSDLLKQKLYAECTDDIGQAMNVTQNEYIKMLVPDDKEQANVQPSLPSNMLSLHALRALPLLEQCRLLLKDAKIIQFQELYMLLTGDGLTPDGLLKVLPQVAVLVRGNWIIKSEVLYPTNTQSAVSGVPAEQMCKARDYVLYLFTQNQFVDRRKVSSIIRLPTEEVKEIFTGISRLRHNRGWELILPIDVDFISKYGEVVQRQQFLWEQRSIQLNDLLKDSGASTSSKRQRRKSKSVSEDVRVKKEPNSSDTDSGTDKQKSPVAARKFFKKSSDGKKVT